ncbi:MAG: YceI family protein [Candidatus Nanopelagicales bacterium]
MELREGSVTIHTDVTGSAARMGHRLVIAVEDWSASVTMARRKPTAVVFRAALTSLTVVSGTGGLTPLTAIDKQVIKRNAAKTLDSAAHPEVVFKSSALSVTGDQVTVVGELTIHAVAAPLTATVTIVDGRATASIPVRQSDFGVKAYSLMLGQLKVADEVVVELAVEVPLQ